MKICPNCKAHLEDNAVFCGECGQRLQAPVETMDNHAESSQSDLAKQSKDKKQDNSLIGCAVIVLLVLWLLVKGCGAIFSDDFDDKEPKGNNTAGAYEVCEFKCNYCGKEIIIDQYANLDRNGDVVGGMPYPPRTEVCPKSKVASREHVWKMKRSKVYINRDGKGDWKRLGK
ncbi:MAG: zinc-ribbon domain-containing protein [Schwartzia sp.]|nr:zinc-ribbon domain-containing protein [Schwartzia sp. (in: firmicutes)]